MLSLTRWVAFWHCDNCAFWFKGSVLRNSRIEQKKGQNSMSCAKGTIVTDPLILPHCETLHPLGLTHWESPDPSGSGFRGPSSGPGLFPGTLTQRVPGAWRGTGSSGFRVPAGSAGLRHPGCRGQTETGNPAEGVGEGRRQLGSVTKVPRTIFYFF